MVRKNSSDNILSKIPLFYTKTMPEVTGPISDRDGYQNQISMIPKSMFINIVSPNYLSNRVVTNSGSGLPVTLRLKHY